MIWYAFGMLNVAYWAYRGFDGAVGGFLIAMAFAVVMAYQSRDAALDSEGSKK